VCTLCEQVETSRLSNILDHIRHHLQLQPYKCDACGLSFSKQYNRDRHTQKSICGVKNSE